MIRAFVPFLGTIGLATLCAFGVFTAWLQMKDGTIAQSTSEQPLVSGVTRSSITALPQARPAVYYEATTQRPLFAPTRRPVMAIIDAVEAADHEPREPHQVAATIPDMQLLGVLQNGRKNAAYIRIGDTEPVWLSEGEMSLGWTLAESTTDSIQLTRDDDRITLEMFEQ